MKKKEFLEELRGKLKGLPSKEVEDQISFYDEMISDMVADGKSEDEAVAEVGGTEVAVNTIADKTPIVTLVKEKMRPKRKIAGWEIALLVLGWPLWFPLLLTGIILLFVAYIVLWVGVIVTFSVELALGATGLAGLVAFVASIADGATSVHYLAFGLMGLGAAILFVYACIAVTKGTLKLARAILLGIKKSFIKGGNKNA